MPFTNANIAAVPGHKLVSRELPHIHGLRMTRADRLPTVMFAVKNVGKAPIGGPTGNFQCPHPKH